MKQSLYSLNNCLQPGFHILCQHQNCASQNDMRDILWLNKVSLESKISQGLGRLTAADLGRDHTPLSSSALPAEGDVIVFITRVQPCWGSGNPHNISMCNAHMTYLSLLKSVTILTMVICKFSRSDSVTG